MRLLSIQVAQPRFPCFKLAAVFNDGEALKVFNRINRSGIYFRVLQEGMIERGQSLSLIHREDVQVPLNALYRFKFGDCREKELFNALELKSLMPSWRKKIDASLNKE